MTLDLVEIRTSDDLIAVIKARRVELGLKQLDVDDIAGLQGGYTGKIECGSKGFGPMSLTALLGALGLVLRVDCTSRTVSRESIALQAQGARGLKEIMRKRMAKVGRARWGKYLPDERRRAMKKVWLGRSKAARSRAIRAAAEKENRAIRPME